MSAEGVAAWQVQQARSWKVTLPCSRAEADALAAVEEPLPGIVPAPVVMTSEPDPARPDAWQIDVYIEGEPDDDAVAAVRALVPEAAWHAVEQVADEDWVTVSQRWLRPIRAGRFFVHTAAFADTAPPGTVAFHIEAGRAFGTGHHETTAGCLEMLDRLATGGAHYRRIADIGTGTGLLAFAAHHLWPDATVLGTDIDPVAIEVTRANMAANALPADAFALVVAPGVDHPRIRAAAPFDLVLANILAAPLIALAPDLAGVVRRDAVVLLAGLLADQEAAVVAAYRAAGFEEVDRLQRGAWPAVALRRSVDRPVENGLEAGDLSL